MKDLISVIIPVYNVENYVEKCVESVINQTWDNLEIILVDDGSKDLSGLLCDKLAEKYKNVQVIHQENKGLSVARNVGLEKSKGEWIAFLDSDDWIEPEMYQILHDTAVNNNTLISSCFSRDIIDGKAAHVEEDGRVKILNHRDIINGLLSGKTMRFEVWNKLWNRELIGDVRFVPGQVAEDVHFDSVLFESAGKIAHVNKGLHNYLITRPGNTNSSFKVARLCIFGEFRNWKTKLEGDGEKELARVISAIAANFAVDIFSNAVRSHQENTIKKELIEQFRYFYPYTSGVQMLTKRMFIKRRFKLTAFHISPSLWILIENLVR